MPSDISELFAAADLEPLPPVRWGTALPETRPGVYAISLESQQDTVGLTLGRCPINPAAVAELIEVRPELTIDEQAGTPELLAERLTVFWLPDESVLYIGLAGTSLRKRIDQYYRTRLGARSPHAGGWFLKTLAVLPELWVHFAPCEDPTAAEAQMIGEFARDVSESSRAQLHDSERVMPFANLEYPKGVRKRHGIRDAKESRQAASEPDKKRSSQAPRPDSRPTIDATTTPQLRTQTVTGADLRGGRTRIPRGATKDAFPRERMDVAIELRGQLLTCRWDPRYGPPERSGVLGIGKAKLGELVREGEVLRVDPGNSALTLS